MTKIYFAIFLACAMVYEAMTYVYNCNSATCEATKCWNAYTCTDCNAALGYHNVDWSCANCVNNPRCLECANVNFCTYCYRSYGADGAGGCANCVSAGCVSCPSDINTCLDCGGYKHGLSGIVCVNCSDPNCAYCGHNYLVCDQCDFKFGFPNGVVTGACTACT